MTRINSAINPKNLTGEHRGLKRILSKFEAINLLKDSKYE